MGYRYIRDDHVTVVGTLWMPAVTCSMRYSIGAYERENIGEPTRENVADWLTSNSGDFQSIEDFCASIGDVEIDWATEEGELAYYDTVSEE